jgi:hypothetical protein
MPASLSSAPEPENDRTDLRGAAVAVVVALAWCVEPHAGAELLLVGAHRHLESLTALDAFDREELTDGEAERLAAFTLDATAGETAKEF